MLCIIALQLLGTIEELQAVKKKHTTTSTSNRTHQKLADQISDGRPTESYPRATDTTNVVKTTQNIQNTVRVERESLHMVQAKSLSPVPLQNTPSSPIATSPCVTVTTTPQHSITTISNSTTHTNVLLSTITTTTTTTSPTVFCQVTNPIPGTSVPGQLKHIAPHQEERFVNLSICEAKGYWFVVCSIILIIIVMWVPGSCLPLGDPANRLSGSGWLPRKGNSPSAPLELGASTGQLMWENILPTLSVMKRVILPGQLSQVRINANTVCVDFQLY